MSSRLFAGFDRELEDEVGELLSELSAGPPFTSRNKPSRLNLSARVLPIRRGPLLLPPEVLQGRPFVQLSYFDFDKTAPTEYHLGVLRNAAQFIASRARTANPIVTVRLVGHTDSRGPANYNISLGLRRAIATRSVLTHMLSRLEPGLDRKLRFVVQSAGSRQPLRRAPSPAGPGLNRRVTVYLTARYSGSLAESSHESETSRPTAVPVGRPSNIPRICCILAPNIPMQNFVDPTNLGTHGSASTEKTGLIYSGKAGFLDLGHIRDMIDVTKYVFDQITALSGGPGTVQTAHGEASLLSKLSSSMILPVSRLIANDDGFAYEIWTYWMSGTGTHNSSFSPEDLCSNNLGTLVAERAILAGGNFNSAATAELDKCVRLLDPQNTTETGAAFRLINNCWVQFGTIFDLGKDSYLRRRNFTPVPWKAGHKSDAATPAFVTSSPPGASGLYQYAHTAGRTIQDSDFATEIAAIRADAVKPTRYGPNYDKPTPCP